VPDPLNPQTVGVKYRLDGRRLPAGPTVKVPQIGWNVVVPEPTSRLLDETGRYYFVHSYYPEMSAGQAGDERGPLAFAWCDYGVRFPAAMEWGLIAATQFHPEKSQRWGIRLLENFAALVRDRAPARA